MTITQVPLVDYLVLGDSPHLTANECTKCGARYFDRRNACASCFATDFKKVAIVNEGIVRSFTIVTFAAPGVPVPFFTEHEVVVMDKFSGGEAVMKLNKVEV